MIIAGMMNDSIAGNFTNFYDAVYAQLNGTGVVKIRIIKDSEVSEQKGVAGLCGIKEIEIRHGDT